jgi:hypothetical protein
MAVGARTLCPGMRQPVRRVTRHPACGRPAVSGQRQCSPALHGEVVDGDHGAKWVRLLYLVCAAMGVPYRGRGRSGGGAPARASAPSVARLAPCGLKVIRSAVAKSLTCCVVAPKITLPASQRKALLQSGRALDVRSKAVLLFPTMVIYVSPHPLLNDLVYS